MIRQTVLIAFCLVVLPAAGNGAGTLAQVAATADLRAPHRVTVERWLVSKPMLRLATEKDCLNVEGLSASRAEYGQSYQPYYAIGDFNHDGQPDFAVALVNKQKSSRKFAMAIFNGPFNQRGTISPALFSKGMDLSGGGLVVQSGGRLVAGVFQSDDCVVLRPRGRTYLMKSCL